MNKLLLIICLFAFMSCDTSSDVSANTQQEQSVEKAASSTVSKPAPINSEELAEVEQNERTQILTNGYIHITSVFERTPSDRYQAQKDRVFKFNLDGSYKLHEKDGSVLHQGSWKYERRGNRQHFIKLDATQDQYNNEYRLQMMKNALVFIGTENYDNAGVQMRADRVDTPPIALVE